MKNKNVGFLITGISFVIGIIVLIFNIGLRNIVSGSCVHGTTCPMYDTISFQTWFSLAIAGIILAIGIFFIFTKEEERIVVKKVKEKKKRVNLNGLEGDEKEVIELLKSEGNAMFQSDLMEKLNIGKVKTTRLLDKLEAKQLIIRKRRGMNNIVVLKN